ncbi:MAG: hypothetical protein ACOX3T_03775 [Bdellovibrionota bacterium]
MNKKIRVATCVLACIIFFGTLQTCLGQNGNPVPRGGGQVEKVEVPQKKQVISEAELKSNQDSLVFKAMLSKVVDKNDPAYKKMLKMPLNERIDLLDEYISTYQEMVDEVLSISGNDPMIKNGCMSKKENIFPTMLEHLEILKSKMPKDLSKKQIERNLLNDPQIPISFATIKRNCMTSANSFDILKSKTKSKNVEALKLIDELIDLQWEIIKVCEATCVQTVPRHKEYLQEKYGMGKPKAVYLYESVNGKRKAYVMGKRGGTAEIPEAVAPNDNRNNGNIP